MGASRHYILQTKNENYVDKQIPAQLLDCILRYNNWGHDRLMLTRIRGEEIVATTPNWRHAIRELIKLRSAKTDSYILREYKVQPGGMKRRNCPFRMTVASFRPRPKGAKNKNANAKFHLNLDNLIPTQAPLAGVHWATVPNALWDVVPEPPRDEPPREAPQQLFMRPPRILTRDQLAAREVKRERERIVAEMHRRVQLAEENIQAQERPAENIQLYRQADVMFGGLDEGDL